LEKWEKTEVDEKSKKPNYSVRDQPQYGNRKKRTI